MIVYISKEYKFIYIMTLNLKDALSFDTLFETHLKCRKGVLYKASVISFDINAFERIIKLIDRLNSESYCFRIPKQIQVYEPKKRIVEGQYYEDRIVGRSICDNILYPIVTNSFTTRNYACQKGRGLDGRFGCINGFKRDLQRYYRKNKSNEGYCLMIDFKKYYEHITKESCVDLLSKYIDVDTRKLIENAQMINYIDNGVGIRGGGQLQQLMGIAIPSVIDHLIEEKFGITCYARYQDDLRIVHKDKSVLVSVLAFVESEMSKLGITLHPKKTQIHKLNKGIPFIGKVFKLTSTGKVIITIKSSVIRHKKSKYKHMLRLASKGGISFEYVDHCFYTMLKSYTRKRKHSNKRRHIYNTYNTCRKLENWYIEERKRYFYD